MNKEIEGNNTMGKTRDLVKDRRYQGSISCKAGYSKKAVETGDRIVTTFWESSHGRGSERASRDVGHGLVLIYLSYLSS